MNSCFTPLVNYWLLLNGSFDCVKVFLVVSLEELIIDWLYLGLEGSLICYIEYHACCFQFSFSGFSILFLFLTHGLASFQSCVYNHLLIFWGHAFEESWIHGEGCESKHVVGFGNILLYVVDLVVADGDGCIFMTIYGSLLQCGEYFAPSHDLGICSESFEGFFIDLAFSNTQLYAGDVSWGIDGAFVVGDVTESTRHEAQSLDSGHIGESVEFLGCFRVEELVYLIPVLQQIRQILYFHFRSEGTHIGSGQDIEGYVSDLKSFHQFSVSTQLSAVVNIDDILSTRLCFN